MCENKNKGSQKTLGPLECNCGCCGCGCETFSRRFISQAEEKERLEGYANQLKKELTGVEERIKELKGK